MKLTTRGHYSVKAMLDLTMHLDEPPQSIRMIARRQNIPQHYLEQLLMCLRRDGLVRSVRGAQGGYCLARPPARISLGRVLAAVGDTIEPLVKVDRSGQPEDWVTFALWLRLHRRMLDVLEDITLEDLYYDTRSHQAAQGEEGSFIV